MAELKRKFRNPDVQGVLEAIVSDTTFPGLRARCADGSEAANRAKNAANPKYKGFKPPVGELCTAVLQHTSDVERDPEARKKSPQESSLALYGFMISGNHSQPYKYEPKPQEMWNLVKKFDDAAKHPEAINRSDPVSFPNDTPGGEKPYSMVPATALDAGYTRKIIETHILKRPAPTPTMKVEDLKKLTEACFKNEATYGQCSKAGAEQAAYYLNGLESAHLTPSNVGAKPQKNNTARTN